MLFSASKLHSIREKSWQRKSAQSVLKGNMAFNIIERMFRRSEDGGLNGNSSSSTKAAETLSAPLRNEKPTKTFPQGTVKSEGGCLHFKEVADAWYTLAELHRLHPEIAEKAAKDGSLNDHFSGFIH